MNAISTPTTQGRVLYSRFEDGAVPVIVGKGTYTVGTTTYKSARALLIALTRHPEARHWTFDRYFRIGKGASTQRPYTPEETILDLFGAANTPAPSVPTVAIVTGGPWPRRVRPAQTKGIDLTRRANEVTKLLYAGYGRRIYGWGYDPEDVLQEVYKGLLIRNAGKCPWDPAKSSFGHYVHMVCGCILSNYHRRMSRQRQVESIGLVAPTEEGVYGNVDVAEACSTRLDVASSQDLSALVDADFIKHLSETVPAKEGRQVALDVLPLVAQGYGRYDIAVATGLPITKVARALKNLRGAMGSWSMTPFMG